MCILMCVYCVKGCASPMELSVVETVVDPPQGGRVSVLVLL